MRKLIYFLLLITTAVQAQIAPPDSTQQIPGQSFTPQFRFYGQYAADGINQFRNPSNQKWFSIYSTFQQHQLFPLKDSVTALLNGKVDTGKLVVFLVAGQSNADGRGDSTLSVNAVDGTWQYYNSLKKVFKNVGSPSSRGSWAVAFANEYYNKTGNHVLFVDAAVGGAAQVAAADNGVDGNWDVTGTRYPEAITMYNNAIAAAIAAGLKPNFGGVIWCQGEQDGRKIDEAVITKAQYKSALLTMLGRFRTQFGANMPFYISRIGYRNAEADSGYVYVQEAQEEICYEYPGLNIMAFRDAGSFRDRNLLIDAVHYKQEGYVQMGVSIARTVTGTLPVPYRTRISDAKIALGRTIIPSSYIDLTDSTNAEQKSITLINKSLGTAAYNVFEVKNGTGSLQSLRIGVMGTNFSGSGGFSTGNAIIEARADLNELAYMTRGTDKRHNFYVGGSLESNRRFSVTSTGGYIRGGSASGITPSTLANNLVIEHSTNGGLTFLNPSNTTASIYFGNDITNSSGRLQYNHPAKYMRFYTNETEAFRVDSNQNIALGSPTTSPLGTLDISQGSGYALVLGASSFGKTRFNNTSKIGRIGIPNYTNGDTPFLAFLGQSTVSTNDLYLGGGSSAGYAATNIKLYVAANNTTTTGSVVGNVSSTGVYLGADVAATATLHLKAHTTGAGTAPLKLTENAVGTMTTAELGAFEFATGNLYFTPSGTTRKRFPLMNNSTPANGTILQGNGTDFTQLALGTPNQMLRVNSGATALEYFTPTYYSPSDTSSTLATKTFLSTNYARKNASNTFTATNTYTQPQTFTGTYMGMEGDSGIMALRWYDGVGQLNLRPLGYTGSITQYLSTINGTYMPYVGSTGPNISKLVKFTSDGLGIDYATAGIDYSIGGNYSDVGAATTTFTVTIGQTMANTTYKTNVTPTSSLSAALFYVTNKTTTTFDVVYLAGLTGTVTFDWTVLP